MFARYFLFETDNGWAISFEGRILSRYGSRTEAIEAGIVMADLVGAMHHDADVMISNGDRLELVWAFGRSKPPRRRKARRTQSAPPALHHVRRIQQGADR